MNAPACESCCNTRVIPKRPEYVSISRSVPDYNWIDCPDCEETDVQTIRCEACDDYGRVISDDLMHTEVCPLCNGTMREPIDVQARDAVEGRARP